ncbi:MAG: DciA family protein [Patescibacteria group bacterium]
MFEPLKNVLNRVLADKKMKASFSAAQICTVAEKLFAAELPALSEKFTVKFVQDGILNIAVTSSAVGSEMHLAETNVVDALNKRKAGIKSVRYQVGPLPEKVTPY